MLGLFFLFAFLIYLLISVWVIAFVVRKARERGIAGWKLGVPAALIMYLLVFWDHIPTLIAHKYYCDKEAGFFVYKTLEEWEKENPGVAETLTWKRLSDSEYKKGRITYYLNERIMVIKQGKELPLAMSLNSDQIIDRQTNDIIAEKKDVNTNIKTLALGNVGLRDYKFWLQMESCFKKDERRKWLHNDEDFIDFYSKFKKLGTKINE